MNKTCGECKWFVLNSEGRCRSNEGEENANNDCCSFFEQKAITNGDVIRQMSNGVLAYMMTRLILDGCPISKSKTLHGCKISNDCTNCLKQWLNAPAESEVNNAGAQGIIIEDRGLYKMMAFEESYIDLKSPISIEQRNIGPAEDTLKAEVERLKADNQVYRDMLNSLLNEEVYHLDNATMTNIKYELDNRGTDNNVPTKESEGEDA